MICDTVRFYSGVVGLLRLACYVNFNELYKIFFKKQYNIMKQKFFHSNFLMPFSLVFFLVMMTSTNIYSQYSIEGMVWDDMNGNGQVDPGEQGLQGVTVKLFKQDGTLLSTTTTGATGNYTIGNEPDGYYYLEFDHPDPSYKHTVANIGADATDSDVDGTNGPGTTALIGINGAGYNDIFAGFAACQSISCHGMLNLSLSGDCTADAYPSMFLTAPQFDDVAYKVEIKDMNGNIIPGKTGFDNGDVGKTFMINIISLICENECWMFVKLEDKMPPQMVCDTVITTCFMDKDSLPLPNIIDNCSDAELELLNEVYIAHNCDTLYTGELQRTWTAVDASGNRADSCVQVILFERINFDSLLFPVNLTLQGGNGLMCDGDYATDPDGHPHPSVTGYPGLILSSGDTIYFDTIGAALVCNAYVTYKDRVLPPIGCTTKIMRKWRIGEWWCTENIDTTHVQMIEITDANPPVVSAMDTIILPTNEGECMSTMSFPLPDATDACCTDLTYSLTYPGGYIPDYTGQIITLPAGANTVTVRVADCCGNTTSIDVVVLVVDVNAPTTICKEYVTVGIGLDGISHVPASVFDLGSYDDCGPVTLCARKMTDSLCTDHVIFDCADAGTSVMVVLEVSDGVNTNSCMVEAIVQDKADPVLVCPDDVDVDCEFTYDENDLVSAFGDFSFTDNCATGFTTTDVLSGNLNDCGTGVLTRTITLFDNGGVNVGSCQQKINFYRPFNAIQVFFNQLPDMEVNCTDDVNLGEPTWTGDRTCDLMAYTVESDTFQFVEGACFKVVNYWTVINWCVWHPGYPDDPTTFNDGIAHHTQIIKVSDPDAPVISQRNDVVISINSTQGDCVGDVTLSNMAIDPSMCVNDILSWQILVDLGGDGTYDITENRVSHSAELVSITIPNVDGKVSGHKIRWIVTDECGNVDAVEYEFKPDDNKKPTPYCQDLSTSVWQDESVEMWAIDFNQNSFDNCTPAENLYYTFSSTPPAEDPAFLPSARSSSMVFTYADVANSPIDITMYVWDQAGNSDFCNVTLTLNGATSGNKSSISGYIKTTNDIPVKNTEVLLYSNEAGYPKSVFTDENGYYDFGYHENDKSYKVVSTKMDDYLKGVSTIDLVMIQRHILQLALLDNPYKIIAADINPDDFIKSSDLSSLRKVILGVDDGFPQQNNWRFVNKDFSFSDPSDPLSDLIEEEYNIPSLNTDMNIDFVAVKIGDVNGNYAPGILGNSLGSSRSEMPFELSILDGPLDKGVHTSIPVKSTVAGELYGLQLTLDIHGLDVTDVSSDIIDIHDYHYDIQGDRLLISLDIPYGISIKSGDVIFNIDATSQTSGRVSDLLKLEDDRMAPEAYIGQKLSVAKVDLRFDNNTSYMNDMELLGSTPNPWTNEVNISFSVPEGGDVLMNVYSLDGKKVYQMRSATVRGKNTIHMDRSAFAESGLLIYELIQGKYTAKGKMIKLK